MALGRNYDGQDCALAGGLALLGERWTLLIVRDAFYGVRRYSDFLAHLDIPRAVLADRLQALVDAGVLEKWRYQDAPPREEYLLTERGQELWPILHRITRWSEKHLTGEDSRRLFLHAACGTRLDIATTCPTCGGTEIAATAVETRVTPNCGPSRRDDPVTKALAAGPRRLLTPLAACSPPPPARAERRRAHRDAVKGPFTTLSAAKGPLSALKGPFTAFESRRDPCGR